jgi:hypothetical protein
MTISEFKQLLEFHVKRVPNCSTHDQFDEWRTFAAQLTPSYTSWFCTDCTPEFQLKHKRKGTCDHPYIKFKRIQGSLDGYVPADWSEEHKKTIKRLINDYPARKIKNDSSSRKLHGKKVLHELSVLSANDEGQVDSDKE